MRVFNDEAMYKKLVEYACSKCNVVSVTKLNYWYDETPRVIQIILRKTNSTEEDIVFKYSEKYLDYLYEYLGKDEEIFDKAHRKKYERIIFGRKSQNERSNENHRFIFIHEVIKCIIYNYNTSMWLRKYKERILLKRERDGGVEYCIRLNESLKKELLEKKSFFDWKFPETLERVSFYKEGKCLLKSTADELKHIEIYLEDEKEYKYLKSIGVKFYEKNFIPISKEKIQYLHEDKLNFNDY